MAAQPLIVVVGETASGKTALAIELARRFNGEIVCADSRTVYRGMDIGTAKPTREEQEIIPHHLVDVIEPNETFSAAHFQLLAKKAMDDIYRRGKLPIIVGGTGLYVDSLLFNFSFGDKADPRLREELEYLTTEELHQRISKKGAEMPVNMLNRRHLVRAIERSGQKMERQDLRPSTLVMGVQLPRADLDTRIEARVAKMIEDGLEAEVRDLSEKFGWEVEAMKSIGYREWRHYFSDEQNLDGVVREIIKDNKHYAKRQRTWFRRHAFIQWIFTPDDAVKITEQFLENQHQL